MARRVYFETVKKWGLSVGAGAVGLVFLLFVYLQAQGMITVTGYSGDMVCAGTEVDPCYAYINFTANDDIYIYPVGYDPWGRGTPFNFDKELKGWVLQRKWGNTWRTIYLNKTWSKRVKYAVKFAKGKEYQIRIIAYKKNAFEDVKWGFANVDPVWHAPDRFSIFPKLIENKADLTYGKAIYEIFNPFPREIPAKHLIHSFRRVKGTYPAKVEMYINTTAYRDVPVYKTVTMFSSCLDNDTGTYVDCSWEQRAVDHYEKEAYESWTPLKSIPPGRHKIKLVAHWQAHTGEYSIEWIPSLKITTEVSGSKFTQLFTRKEWAWWNGSWGKRKAINLTTSSGTTPSEYQVRLNVTYDSDMQTDFDDLRFVDNDDSTLLPAWLEEKSDGNWAVVWVKVNDTIGTEGTTIYMYYGNSGASNYWDNSTLTYDMFNYPDGTFTGDDWLYPHPSDPSSNVDYTISGGTLYINRHTSVDAGSVETNYNQTYPLNITLKVKVVKDSQGYNYGGFGIYITDPNQGANPSSYYPSLQWTSGGVSTTAWKIRIVYPSGSYVEFGTLTQDYGWHTFKFYILDQNHVSIYVDGTAYTTNYAVSTSYPSEFTVRVPSSKADTGAGSANNDGWYVDDWVVRSYFSSDVTATFGNEETEIPNVDIIFPTNNTYPHTIALDLNFTYEESNPNTCWYSINGSSNTTIGYTNGTDLSLSEGSYHLQLWCSNTLGGIGSDEVWFSIAKFSWWNDSWARRQAVLLTTPSGTTPSGYQYRLNVSYASGMQSDFDDLRFVDDDGSTLLPAWLEDKSDGNWATVWVKVNDAIGTGGTTIYMYYGNSGANNYWNGDDTFDFFDDFEGTSLNMSKWTEVSWNYLTYSVHDGILDIHRPNGSPGSNSYWIYSGGGDVGSGQLQTSLDLDNGYMVEIREYIDDDITNPAGGNENGQVGIGLVDTSTNYVKQGIFQSDGGGNDGPYLILRTYDGISNTGTAKNTEWTILGLANIDGTLKYFQERSEIASTSINSNKRIAIITGQTLSPLFFYEANLDWFIIRKYADPEPTASFGSEEAFLLENTTIKLYLNNTEADKYYELGYTVNITAQLVDSSNNEISDGTVYLSLDALGYGDNFISDDGTVTYLWTSFAAKNKFNDSDTAKNFTYSGTENHTAYVQFNKRDVINTCTLNLTGYNSSGSYPYNVSIWINGTLSNLLNGYLIIGEQTQDELIEGSTANLTNPGNNYAYVMLPSNAEVTSAYFNITNNTDWLDWYYYGELGSSTSSNQMSNEQLAYDSNLNTHATCQAASVIEPKTCSFAATYDLPINKSGITKFTINALLGGSYMPPDNYTLRVYNFDTSSWDMATECNVTNCSWTSNNTDYLNNSGGIRFNITGTSGLAQDYCNDSQIGEYWDADGYGINGGNYYSYSETDDYLKLYAWAYAGDIYGGVAYATFTQNFKHYNFTVYTYSYVQEYLKLSGTMIDAFSNLYLTDGASNTHRFWHFGYASASAGSGQYTKSSGVIKWDFKYNQNGTYFIYKNDAYYGSIDTSTWSNVYFKGEAGTFSGSSNVGASVYTYIYNVTHIYDFTEYYLNETRVTFQVETAEDPAIDIGADSSVDWSYSGYLTDEEQTSNLSSAFNTYLDSCIANSYGNCQIPIKLGGTGAVTISDLEINYTQEFNPISLNSTLIQSYLDGSPNTYVDVPITIKATNGTVQVDDLNFSFYGSQNVTVTANFYGSDTYSASNASRTIKLVFSSFSVEDAWDWLAFYPSSNNEAWVEPYGQTSSMPFWNITSLAYDQPMNLRITLAEPLDSCVDITISNTSDYTQGVNITSQPVYYYNLQPLQGNATFWLWASLHNCDYSSMRYIIPTFYIDSCCTECDCW